MNKLSPRNPVDHLRLLWWLLAMPHCLLTYREAFGEQDERDVGKWLSSTIAWLPPFIFTLGLGLGTLPRTDGTGLSLIYLGASAVLVLAWVLTSKLEDELGCLPTAVALGTILLILVAALGFRVRGRVAGGLEVSLGVGFAIGVTVGIAPAVPGGVPNTVSFLITSIVSIVVGRSAFIIACIVVLVIVEYTEKAVRRTLEAKRPSWLGAIAFGILVLTYVFIAWFSLLDGWSVFV